MQADSLALSGTEAVDPKTQRKVSLYFNIDRPYGALEKLFKK